MTADNKFWPFPKIADTAAQEKHGERWRLFADDYLGALVADFWRSRVQQVFHRSIGFVSQTPDTITREVVWRMLGVVARPLAFHGVQEREMPDWEALAQVPPEDYGPGLSPPGIRSTFMVQLLLPEAEARDWIRMRGKAKRPRARPVEWDWDGAVAHLLAVANTPNGLPETQVKIEHLVEDWFDRTYGDTPVESAIRKHVKIWCKDVFLKASK